MTSKTDEAIKAWQALSEEERAGAVDEMHNRDVNDGPRAIAANLLEALAKAEPAGEAALPRWARVIRERKPHHRAIFHLLFDHGAHLELADAYCEFTKWLATAPASAIVRAQTEGDEYWLNRAADWLAGNGANYGDELNAIVDALARATITTAIEPAQASQQGEAALPDSVLASSAQLADIRKMVMGCMDNYVWGKRLADAIEKRLLTKDVVELERPRSE